ncbi:hypothetical protein DYB38_013215 [Aphanomyces astaci]|uniref:DDE Tnp4 domain-containing protein n=1 Tax=Aphanomyces astaci TaxID=112090 RepID=A0A397C0T5_APHAT|nr:hypothetical protein DYB38_013215 [Aphanomyces astaci]
MYIDTVLDKYSMQHLHTSGHQFNNFPSALYAVDVTYRRTNTPAGSFNEKKRFYSKKHGQYGLKVEASVLPNDLTINVATAVSGSVADITICESNVDFHQDKLKKNGETTTCWTTAQCKKSILGRGLCLLTKATKAFTANCDHSDEATSSRLKTLWSVVGDTYTWKRENYDLYFQTCVVFTNLYIRFLPLREVDGDDLHRHVSGLLSSGQKKKAKRAGSVMKSREKRKRRLSSLFSTGESAQFTSEVDFYDSADESSIFD